MRKIISKGVYTSMDLIMYTMMNYIQWQLRHDVTPRKELISYLDTYASWDRASYFAPSPMEDLHEEAYKPSQLSRHDRNDMFELCWKSPHASSFIENNHAHALFFPAPGRAAEQKPTLIILHALMSASDRGYRRLAKSMNEQGWNVLFPHLPFHYSRTPAHHTNGALAISANLIRNAETVRQAVQETRQIMAWSRHRGSQRIGLLATSYGGWIASLLLSLEEIDFALLLQPIIDLPTATFQSPLARVMGALLRQQGISEADFHAHAHLTAPAYARPITIPERIGIIGGSLDCVSPPATLRRLAGEWQAHYREVSQGHFGYEAMKQALVMMERFQKR